MKSQLFLLLALVLSSTSAYAEPIPASWHGTWKGILEYRLGGQPAVRSSMTLIIEPVSSDTLRWAIQYEGQPVRDYAMKHQQGGHYIVDEKNGILIDHVFVDGVLYSQFEVMGRRFTIEHRLVEGKIVESGNTFQIEGARESGGQTVPEVRSYPLVSYQRAVLTRQP
jgi:hypothetical protein